MDKHSINKYADCRCLTWGLQADSVADRRSRLLRGGNVTCRPERVHV